MEVQEEALEEFVQEGAGVEVQGEALEESVQAAVEVVQEEVQGEVLH